MKNNLTPAKNEIIVNYPLQQAGGGFGSPFGTGAEAMHHKVHGFFYALHTRVLNAVLVMVGVLGGFKACRILYPVYQPNALTAQRLVAPVGDNLNHSTGVIS